MQSFVVDRIDGNSTPLRHKCFNLDVNQGMIKTIYVRHSGTLVYHFKNTDERSKLKNAGVDMLEHYPDGIIVMQKTRVYLHEPFIMYIIPSDSFPDE